MTGLAELLTSGAGGNAVDIVRLRKAYNEYVLGGGQMTFPEFAKKQGTNPNPYQNPKS